MQQRCDNDEFIVQGLAESFGRTMIPKIAQIRDIRTDQLYIGEHWFVVARSIATANFNSDVLGWCGYVGCSTAQCCSYGSVEGTNQIDIVAISQLSDIYGIGPCQFENTRGDVTPLGTELMGCGPGIGKIDPWREYALGEWLWVLREEFDAVGALKCIGCHALNERVLVQPG